MPTHEDRVWAADRGMLNHHLAHLLATRGADEEVAVLALAIDRAAGEYAPGSTDHPRAGAADHAVLAEVAARLRAIAGSDDVVARLDRDELVVVAVVTGVAGAYQLAEAICDAFASPVEVDGTAVTVTTSIGLATSAQAGGRIGLLQAAGFALAEARAVGPDCWVNFLPGITPQPDLSAIEAWPGAQLEQLLAHLAAQIPAAIAENQLVVGYRPAAVDGGTRRLDAVVRWHHPTLGVLPASAFAAAVERSPHLSALTGEVLRQACGQLARWQIEGMDELEVSVPIAPSELLDRRIVDRVRRALAGSGLPPGALSLETTVADAVLDHPEVRRTVARLEALGVRVEAAGTRRALELAGV